MQAAYVDKSITLRGGYRLADWTLDPASNPTTLDAQQLGRVLTISGDIAPVIEGFRLTRGAAANGGGVYIQTAAATLRNNDVYEQHRPVAAGQASTWIIAGQRLTAIAFTRIPRAAAAGAAAWRPLIARRSCPTT